MIENTIYSNEESSHLQSAVDEITEYNLENLLAYNQQRLEDFQKRPLFTILQNGTLADAKKRQIFLDSMQIWTEGNQTLLFARQATCHDPYFQLIFLKHLQEEIGHDELYNNRPNRANFSDPIMEAITTWFLHQMFVLDNLEKATIIHLGIESASDVYHKIAKPQLVRYINEAYFAAHDVDVEHIAMGIKLLSGYSPKVYLRLKTVLGKAWDMLTAMVDRVAYLVEADGRTPV